MSAPITPVPTPAEPAEPAAVEPAVEPTAAETATIPAAELNALRRQVAESAKAARKAEADARLAAETQQAEQGQWKQLAETAQRERDAAATENARIMRDQRVSAIAHRLSFRDPTDVLGRVTAEEGETDASCEAALQRIAQASPHLVNAPTPPPPVIGQVLAPGAVETANASLGGPGTTYTEAQVRAMTAKDFAAMDAAQFAAVQRVLANLKPAPPAA